MDLNMTLAIACSAVLTVRTVSERICHMSTRLMLLDKSFTCQGLFPNFLLFLDSCKNCEHVSWPSELTSGR